MTWIMKTVVGIEEASPAYRDITIRPFFFKNVVWAKGSIQTPLGETISVEWYKKDRIYVSIIIPTHTTAKFRDALLDSGKYSFVL